MATFSFKICVVKQFAARLGLAITVTLAFPCESATARETEDSCPILTNLRSMSADHFKEQRGKALDIDEEQEIFMSTYHMAGAAECTVKVYGSNESIMSCMWFLQRGIDAEPTARDQFLRTADSFQSCVKDRDGVEVNNRRNSRGAYVILVDRFVSGQTGNDYTVRIDYSWSAPWWYLHVEYQRSDF